MHGDNGDGAHLANTASATAPSGFEKDGIANLVAAICGLVCILDTALQVELLRGILIDQVATSSAV